MRVVASLAILALCATPAAAQSVEAMVRETEAAGLPSELLELKAREGAAKGVPAARIVVVLAGMRAQLGEAGRLLDAASGGTLSAAERRQLAGSLMRVMQLGVGAPALDGLVRAGFADRSAPARAAVVYAAVETLGGMAVQGYERGEAADLVTLAIEQGFEPGDFTRLSEVMRDAAGRKDAAAAMRSVHGILKGGGRPDWVGVKKGGIIDENLPHRGRGPVNRPPKKDKK